MAGEDDNSLWAPLIDVLVERGHALVVFACLVLRRRVRPISPGAADGIATVVAAVGPIDAVVARFSRSRGGALRLFRWRVVDQLVLSPRTSNRWLRYAERLGVTEDITFAAQSIYEERIGPTHTSYDFRAELSLRSMSICW